MIFCVVPEALAGELYDKLVRYYADDDNVTVMVDRRHSERRSRSAGTSEELDSSVQQRLVRDRRRARVPGEFPELDVPAGGTVGAT